MEQRIVEAATRLFLERGYGGTTVPQIAREAGVAIQTIYNTVGSKRAVLSRVLDYRVQGKHAPTPVREFLGDRVRKAREARAMVALLAEWFAIGAAAALPIFRVIREAAATEPEIAALERQRAEQRLAGYTEAARDLRARGGLANELTDDDAAAYIWTIGHPDIHHFLVDEQGWSTERYRIWVERAMERLLLGEEGR